VVQNTTYEIEVFRDDQDDRLEALSQALGAELEEIGLHRTLTVATVEFEPGEAAPSAGVYLSSPAALADGALTERLIRAIEAGRVILPVVDDLGQFTASVPEILHSLNGHEWSGPEPERGLARFLLEQLGIEERQRRVFISHKRDDGLGAAEQLHDHLSKMGFEPFIDRFAIRGAEEVQTRIAEALEDHAFMLLLETPFASTSPWVFDEVDYALSHTMGTLILRWPGEHDQVPGSPGVPRLGLLEEDLYSDPHGYDVLTDAALDRVLSEVEAAHAHGLVRRRRMLIQSIADAAAAAGYASVALPDWRLTVRCPSESTLLGITPRLPTAEDLQFLDQARSHSGEGSPAVLVHAARELGSELRTHLSWVSADRELVVMPENAIGGRWTKA
jgi:hypothetical protein